MRAGDPAVQTAGAEAASEIVVNRFSDRFPLVDLSAAAPSIAAEIVSAVGALPPSVAPIPAPLEEAAQALVELSDRDRRSLVENWLDDASLVDPRIALWVRVAAAPILELAAARISPPSKEEWGGRACPACGDVPQCSVIIEATDGFLQGAPRYLICGRCALWWGFPRAVCPSCGEDDSRRISPYVADRWSWARIDACDTCSGYVKTFDLRSAEAKDVVPLVDDVVTLVLDLWAHDMGLKRPAFSVAGV